MRKPVKCGLDFARNTDWSPVMRDIHGAESFGRKMMPSHLRSMGFGVAVFDAGEYFRISFGRKA